MKKLQELTNYKSCFNKAYPEEMLFVLLERDVSAPAAIRAWVEDRIRRGKNKQGDDQTVEALTCAQYMERSNQLPGTVAEIREILKRAAHTEQCKLQLESSRCICGVYSAQNRFEQMIVDYQIGMPK